MNAALDLFNAQGTDAVSTNHIAEALGLSPGNLYYHFRNKADIIRALFEQLFADTDHTFSVAPDHSLKLDDASGWLRVNFEIIWRYRFAYRETLALLAADAQLRERYLVVRKRGYEGFREIFAGLAQAGLLINVASDETIDELADLCWLISDFWLPNIELSGNEVSAAQMQRGIDLMTRILKPYIRDLS